jgi:hypothetical protein
MNADNAQPSPLADSKAEIAENKHRSDQLARLATLRRRTPHLPDFVDVVIRDYSAVLDLDEHNAANKLSQSQLSNISIELTRLKKCTYDLAYQDQELRHQLLDFSYDIEMYHQRILSLMRGQPVSITELELRFPRPKAFDSFLIDYERDRGLTGAASSDSDDDDDAVMRKDHRLEVITEFRKLSDYDRHEACNRMDTGRLKTLAIEVRRLKERAWSLALTNAQGERLFFVNVAYELDLYHSRILSCIGGKPLSLTQLAEQHPRPTSDAELADHPDFVPSPPSPTCQLDQQEISELQNEAEDLATISFGQNPDEKFAAGNRQHEREIKREFPDADATFHYAKKLWDQGYDAGDLWERGLTHEARDVELIEAEFNQRQDEEERTRRERMLQENDTLGPNSFPPRPRVNSADRNRQPFGGKISSSRFVSAPSEPHASTSKVVKQLFCDCTTPCAANCACAGACKANCTCSCVKSNRPDDRGDDKQSTNGRATATNVPAQPATQVAASTQQHGSAAAPAPNASVEDTPARWSSIVGSKHVVHWLLDTFAGLLPLPAARQPRVFRLDWSQHSLKDGDLACALIASAAAFVLRYSPCLAKLKSAAAAAASLWPLRPEQSQTLLSFDQALALLGLNAQQSSAGLVAGTTEIKAEARPDCPQTDCRTLAKAMWEGRHHAAAALFTIKSRTMLLAIAPSGEFVVFNSHSTTERGMPAPKEDGSGCLIYGRTLEQLSNFISSTYSNVDVWNLVWLPLDRRPTALIGLLESPRCLNCLLCPRVAPAKPILPSPAAMKATSRVDKNRAKRPAKSAQQPKTSAHPPRARQDNCPTAIAHLIQTRLLPERMTDTDIKANADEDAIARALIDSVASHYVHADPVEIVARTLVYAHAAPQDSLFDDVRAQVEAYRKLDPHQQPQRPQAQSVPSQSANTMRDASADWDSSASGLPKQPVHSQARMTQVDSVSTTANPFAALSAQQFVSPQQVQHAQPQAGPAQSASTALGSSSHLHASPMQASGTGATQKASAASIKKQSPSHQQPQHTQAISGPSHNASAAPNASTGSNTSVPGLTARPQHSHVSMTQVGHTNAAQNPFAASSKQQPSSPQAQQHTQAPAGLAQSADTALQASAGPMTPLSASAQQSHSHSSPTQASSIRTAQNASATSSDSQPTLPQQLQHRQALGGPSQNEISMANANAGSNSSASSLPVQPLLSQPLLMHTDQASTAHNTFAASGAQRSASNGQLQYAQAQAELAQSADTTHASASAAFIMPPLQEPRVVAAQNASAASSRKQHDSPQQPQQAQALSRLPQSTNDSPNARASSISASSGVRQPNGTARKPSNQHRRSRQTYSSRSAAQAGPAPMDTSSNSRPQSPSAPDTKRLATSRSSQPLSAQPPPQLTGQPPAPDSKLPYQTKHMESYTQYLQSFTAERLMLQGPLMDKPPPFVQQKLLRNLKPILLKLSKLSVESNDRAEHEALLSIFLASAVFMLKRSRGGDHGKRRAQAQQRYAEDLIRRFLAGQIEPAEFKLFANRLERKRAERDRETSTILRAKKHLENGYVRKASKTLRSSGIGDPSNPAVRAALEQAHPPASAPLPDLPQDAPTVTVDPDNILSIVKEMARDGSAAGPSGITAVHLLPFVNEKQSRQALAVVISNICNGRYSDSIRDLLLSNKGLALEKNPEPNPSWRPLGIGETLYRIAGSVVTSDPATKEAIVKHCGEFQLGLGKPSGTEAVPHIVLLSLLNPQPVAAIHVDVKNAFNTRSRASMLNTLFSQPELGKLWRLAHFRYKQPTKIFYQQASGSIALTLESREGCTQGDNLGTTLFDLDYSLDLEEALKADPSGEVQLVALHDDVYIIGPPDKLRAVYEALKRSMATHGSQIQPAKSEFLYFNSAPLSAAVQEFIAEERFKTRLHAATVAGAVVAKSSEAGAQLYAEEAAQCNQFFRRLQSELMPVQHALYLLRVSGPVVIDYSLRTTLSPFTTTGAQHVDSLTLDTLSAKLQVPLRPDDQVVAQLRLPANLGGIGPFRPKCDLAPLAYCASQAACAEYLAKSRWTDHSTAHHLRQQLLEHLASLIDPISTVHDLRERLPKTGQDFIGFFSEDRSRAVGLQGDLTRIITHRLVDKAGIDSSRRSTARFNSLLEDGAADVFHALPTSAHTKMTDHEMRLVVRHRLDLPPTLLDPLPAHCTDCNRPVASDDKWHPLTCTSNTMRDKTARHDALVHVIAQNAKRAGAQVLPPPRVQTTSKKVPDLEIDMDDMQLLIDCVIPDPQAPANLAINSDCKDRAERRKRAKYGTIVKRQDGFFFSPFAIDTFGAHGDSAKDVIDKISEYASDHSLEDLTPAQLRTDFQRQLAVKLHKHNAHITQRWLCRERSRKATRSAADAAARMQHAGALGSLSLH